MGRLANGSVVAAWKVRLARQRSSGLSVAEFCRREGVSPPSFYQWRRRLRPGRRATAARPLFVPIEMAFGETAVGVQIELPGGAVVRLPAAASAALLTTAIRAAMNEGASGIAAAEGPSC